MKLLARLERLEPQPQEQITKTWVMMIVSRNEAGELVEEEYDRITWTAPRPRVRTQRWKRHA